MGLPGVVAEHFVDLERYPLAEPGSARDAVVARARAELAETGCCVLADFLRPRARAVLGAECAALAPLAHASVERVNAYNIALDTPLPPDHPGRVVLERGNAFVARDQIPPTAIVHQLYLSPVFQRFVADCFDLAEVHPLADPLSGLCLNVLAPGREHPWHFDINEFTVSMLTQPASDGGIFEYCPNIRSADDENLAAVAGVLAGERDLVRALPPRVGDLQLFRGRFALHRVSTVTGATERHSAIFAYSARPGMVGGVERTRQLFGRVLPDHARAAELAVRCDDLLD